MGPLMMSGDARQKVFEDYEVPDPVRIQKVLDFIRSHFGNTSGISVLECGFCRGGVADLLSRDGADCWGIDINSRQAPNIKFIRADLNTEYPRIEENFDVIFAGEIIEHIYDDSGFIRWCRGILKADGILAATVPNLGYSLNRLLVLLGEMPMFVHAPYHYHIYNKATLRSLIENEGFEILKFSSSHVLFSTRRNRFGRIFEKLGDYFPSLGAHLIVFAKRSDL